MSTVKSRTAMRSNRQRHGEWQNSPQHRSHCSKTGLRKQVAKVIWHQAASPPQTDSSVVFARWRVAEQPTVPVPLLENRVKNKQVVTVIWHKAVQSYSPGGAPSYEATLAPPGEYDWTCASFSPPKSTTQTANWSVQPCLQRNALQCKARYCHSNPLCLFICPSDCLSHSWVLWVTAVYYSSI